MQALTFLTALASILLFEGGRRLFASPRAATAWLIVLIAGASIAAAACLHVAEHAVYQTIGFPDEGDRFKAGPPWKNPKEALSNLPLAEQAEKTRILAVGYYTSTGKLIEHLLADGSAIRLVPTQDEIKLREDWLSWRVSTEAHVAHTTNRPTHLLLIVLVAGVSLLVFRRQPSKSAT
jgi:hypothetical protein